MEQPEYRSIFREEALQHYLHQSTEENHPREITAPSALVLLWLILGVCLLTGLSFWFIYLGSVL